MTTLRKFLHGVFAWHWHYTEVHGKNYVFHNCQNCEFFVMEEKP